MKLRGWGTGVTGAIGPSEGGEGAVMALGSVGSARKSIREVWMG